MVIASNMQATKHNLELVSVKLTKKPNTGSWLTNFFNFYIFFSDLSKIYADFFLQKCHPAASSTGGMKVPPDEPVAGAL